LADGSIGDVWEIVEAGDLPDFAAIGDVDNALFEACRDAVLGKLKKVLSRIDDDRIVARILDEIEFEDAPSLVPALQEALRHGSPEVRRRALRAVTHAEDPVLAAAVESRFELERDGRVRIELVRALAASGSRRFLPELRELARGDERPLRRAALEALLDLPDPASVLFLAEIASSPSNRDAAHAGSISLALSSWSDVPGIDAALAGIGRDGPEDEASQAITALEQRGDAALGALAAIANARERTGERTLVEQAQSAIARVQGEAEEDTISIKFSCGFGGRASRGLPLASQGGVDPTGSSVMTVIPSDGSETARCWDAPGWMWPGEIRARVPAGAEVMIFDEFYWDDQRWVAGVAIDRVCWMREADLAADLAESEARAGAAPHEFDLSIAELHSWGVGRLERRGWLTVLSVEDTVATLRLRIEEPTRTEVSELIDIRRNTDAPGLVAAIDQWLWRHASGWSNDAELGGVIPKDDPRWAIVNVVDDE